MLSISWSSASTLTPNRPELGKIRFMFDRLSSDTSIKGGANETDTNAFAVMPCGRSCSSDVITVTPVANRPKAFRNARVSKDCFVSADILENTKQSRGTAASRKLTVLNRK